MPVFYAIEQRSPEWYEARKGIPTASEFKVILREGVKRGDPSITRRKYLYRLVGERITGLPAETYESPQMIRGREMEPEARAFYSFIHGTELTQVGFIESGGVGCSPDSLIGNDGLLEIKTADPHVLIDLIVMNRFPPEHVAQCQGAMWVSGRQWIDLMVYCPLMPPFERRLHRDPGYIDDLAREVEVFCTEIANLESYIRGYGVVSPLRTALEASLASP